MPPLTPGTNQKMSQALLASFQSFEKEQQRTGIPKGKEGQVYVRVFSLNRVMYCIVCYTCSRILELYPTIYVETNDLQREMASQ